MEEIVVKPAAVINTMHSLTFWILQALLGAMIIPITLDLINPVWVQHAVGAVGPDWQRNDGTDLLLIVGFALGIWILRLPVKARHTLKYIIREHDILFEKGLLSRHQISIPMKSIRLVRCQQPAADRALNLGTIILDSAGSVGGEIVMRGINDHERIADEIRRRMNLL